MKEKINKVYAYLKTVDNLYMKTVFTIIAIALILICIGVFDIADKLRDIDSSVHHLSRKTKW